MSFFLTLAFFSSPLLTGAEGGLREPLTPRVVQGEELVLSNGILRLAFDAKTGELRQVENTRAGLALLPAEGAASRLPDVALGGDERADRKTFRYEVLAEGAARQELLLKWSYTLDIVVEVRVELAAAQEMAYFWPRVVNSGPASIISFTYPNFPRLNTLGPDASDDYLVHPLVRGIKVRDPKHSLDISHNPIREARYPQAYNGMTHQLVDYYSEGVGGFFFVTFDPYATEKQMPMPFYEGEMGISWTYLGWDHRAGQDMDLGFPFVIGANLTGDWYAAADHYREWALTTPWCQSRGPNVKRRAEERAAWLFEDVGAATFGMSARIDQSAWLASYHALVGTPLFHVLGYDVSRHKPRDEEWNHYGVEIAPANLRTIETNGDYWASFLADIETNFLPVTMAMEVGRLTISVALSFSPEACPKGALWQHIHRDRVSQVVSALGADSAYFDASAPNRQLMCENLEHGHPRGRGRWMLDAYREMYAGTQQSLGEACARYTPMGVELMHEALMQSFDYYQARNGGGFMGTLEGGFYRGLQLRGLAETVPVFTYIYHDYAPVALDGCGKVSQRLGDIFYWMAARVALAGGIFELNNEFSPPERFPGMSRVGQLHYRNIDSFEWVEEDAKANSPYDPQKGEFLREIALARTDFAQDFLAYGRMLPPLDLKCASIQLGFNYYNNIDWGGTVSSLKYADAVGSYETPQVLHSAWSFDGRLGLLFVNLGPASARVEVEFDLDRYRKYGLEFAGQVQGKRKSSWGTAAVELEVGKTQTLVLESRKVTLLEF